MSVDLEGFVEKALLPLSGDNPCGVDAKYEEKYERITEQILKLTSMSSLEDFIDFELIAANSNDLLAETTKDINVAGYACYALLETQGYKGLAAGLKAYTGILETFWDNLFPKAKRMKARANAIEWLSERAGDLADSKAPKPSDAEALTECLETVLRMTEIVKEKFPEGTPSLYNLTDTLKKHASAAPAKPKEQPAAAPPPAQTPIASAQAPAPAAAAPVDVKSGTPTEILASIRKLSSALRKTEPESALPYRINRALKWDKIASSPPADGGKTSIPGPRKEEAQAMNTLAASGNTEALLSSAEDAFTGDAGIFWLDLQRHVYTALKKQGPGAQVAAEAVASATSAFVARLSGVEELSFSSGIGFADQATRKWLDELSAQSGGGKKVEQVLISPTAQAAKAERVEMPTVKTCIESGDLEGALTALQDAIDSETSPKLRFLRKLDAARFCMEQDQPRWAKAILENVSHEMQQFAFDNWEPELARDALRLKHSCYKALAMNAKSQDAENLMGQAEETLDQLLSQDLRLGMAADPRKK